LGAAAVKHLFHAAHSAKKGGYVGHGTNAGCPRPDIELSPCIKTKKSTSTMIQRGNSWQIMCF